MKRVLVFGDAIADVYTECSYKKECPDAPGVNAYVTRYREVRPGGAANVAANLALLSPNVLIDLVAVVDVQLARALKQASQSRVDVSHCVFHDDAIIKERVYQDGRLVMRIDSAYRIGEREAELLKDALDKYLSAHSPDLVVLSDYAAGSLTDKTLGVLPRERLLVDTKETDLSKFVGSLMIKLNRSELHAVLETESTPERFCKGLVTTLGEDGAVLHMRGPHPKYTSTTITHTLSVKALMGRADVVDVCGCGDTFLAGMAASLLLNDDLYTAMQFGNAAAATVVTRPRTSVASLEETSRLLGRNENEAR